MIQASPQTPYRGAALDPAGGLPTPDLGAAPVRNSNSPLVLNTNILQPPLCVSVLLLIQK